MTAVNEIRDRSLDAWQKLAREPHTRRGQEIVGRCPIPGHEDQHPSNRFNAEKRVWKCEPCGRGGDVFTLYGDVHGLDVKRDFRTVVAGLAKLLGIENGDADGDHGRSRPAETVYRYTDGRGNLIGHRVRVPRSGGGKDVFSRRLLTRDDDPALLRAHGIKRVDEERGFVWSWSRIVRDPAGRCDKCHETGHRLEKLEAVPYRLQELAATPSGEPVFLNEGEKAADRVAAVGLASTCFPGGAAAKWQPAWEQHFVGRNVVIIPDNDEPGRDHARKVAAALGLSGDREEDEARVLLLADMRDAFDELGDKVATARLLERLHGMETRPWPEWRRGKPITDRQLATLLRPFAIAPKTVRLEDGSTPKGYDRSDLEDAFRRYLRSRSATPPQPAPDAAFSDFPSATKNDGVADEKRGKPASHKDCGGVAATKPGPGEEREIFEV